MSLTSLIWFGAGAATWFSGASHALPAGDSASPDAPATFVSYGPRAEAGIGVETSVLKLTHQTRTFRFGLAALSAFANGTGQNPLPGQLGRTAIELSTSWAFALDRSASVFEWGIAIGRRWAFATEGYWLQDPYFNDSVPFGAGGSYLALGAQAKHSINERWEIKARLEGKGFTNAWLDLARQSELSDGVADALDEGARWQLALELGTRWHLCPCFEPLAWLYSDVIDPHDDTGKTLWLTRLQAGGAVPLSNWEWVSYANVEAGHGSGLLVNRTEFRLGLGMRLDAR
jgi:hypothetical protein